MSENQEITGDSQYLLFNFLLALNSTQTESFPPAADKRRIKS